MDWVIALSLANSLRCGRPKKGLFVVVVVVLVVVVRKVHPITKVERAGSQDAKINSSTSKNRRQHLDPLHHAEDDGVVDAERAMEAERHEISLLEQTTQ